MMKQGFEYLVYKGDTEEHVHGVYIVTGALGNCSFYE